MRMLLLSGSGALFPVTCGQAQGVRDPEGLDILRGGYPRAFFFRASEGAQSEGRYPTYESWERHFDRLRGIMGKCLEEECLGRERRNPAFFSEFKRRHPNQVVLLHFNGNSRDPLYQTGSYFPGHWIYRRAVPIRADVPAEAGESVIEVEDVGDFRVQGGRYRTSPDDIALFGMTADGRHDWSHCEQVRLLDVDPTARTIRVSRGCYGTRPLAFRAGASRAAAHAAEGPWGATNNLLWFYNYATHCPRDDRGRTCADVLVEDLARWFGPEGVLAAFDGVEFDVLFNETHGDTDGDGTLDNGVIDGRNHYGIGVVEFVRALRARLGSGIILQADGALGRGGARSQRAFGLLNGIESEGWPNLNDWEIEDWSGGMNRHLFWQRNAQPPAFSYINHKWVQGIPGRPGHHRQVDVPFSRHRLVLAAAQCMDAMVCYSSAPQLPPGTGYTFWQRDVRVPPGAVLTYHIGMGPLSPERSDGVWFRVLAAELTGEGPGEFTVLAETATREHAWLPQSVDLGAYGDRAVRLKFLADCGPADNAVTDHASWGAVRLESGREVQELVSASLPVGGMCIRNRSEQDIDPTTGAWLRHEEQVTIAGVSHPAYSTHPPYRSQAAFDRYPVWDELLCGAARTPGWLGLPESATVHQAESTPDLLAGRGHGADLAARIRGAVEVSVEGAATVIRPQGEGATSLTFRVRDVPAHGEDLTVLVRLQGAAPEGYPREMARFATVSASGGMVDLMADRLDATGMCLRGQAEQAVEGTTGAQVVQRVATVGGISLPTVFVHPPWRDGSTGYTFWVREVDVPDDPELRFSIAMGEKSPERSDGVWFSVHAAVVERGVPGAYEKVFEATSKAHEWLPQTVSLGPYGGRRLRLKFVADAGPRDDSTTDHAHWGAVRIVPSGVDESRVTQAAGSMTWVNDQPFTSSFYYRHIRSDRVDLTFTIESPEPVLLHSIRAYAHPDTLYRAFANGLVLANPSRHPASFDLRAIRPGVRYRRLQATEHQDGQTNNGQRVGDTVTLGERDGLFLLREQDD
ncbi:MAG: hypothetical protein JXR77_10755 [Lentisphaeria bacterium]|nr:hypothetical protein [Lentisphaeria bacterium]